MQSGEGSAEAEGTAIWLDPGGTTGIATWVFETREFRSWQEDFLFTGRRLELLAAWPHPVRIGWEQYNLLPGSYARHDGSALMVIGMARWLALVHGMEMLPSQPNSARRLGLRNLELAGWHRKGMRHANDAAAHLLTWAIATGVLPEELKEKLRGNG